MLLQQLVNGLTLGAVYTLVALSFSLVMGLLSILNIAIGELFMLGGYIGFAVIAMNVPLFLALLAGMAGSPLWPRSQLKKSDTSHCAIRRRSRRFFRPGLFDHLAECRYQYLGF